LLRRNICKIIKVWNEYIEELIMEEMTPKAIGQDIGEFCKDMHLRVKEDGDPVMAHVNGVRIIMFKEERYYDSQYDGPGSTTS
jgi:hypothetical protein